MTGDIAADSASDRLAARNRMLGVAFAATGAGLFSLKGVVIKLAFAEGMSVQQLLTLRMAFSLPVYLAVGVYAYFRSGRRPTPKTYLAAAGLGVMSYYLSSWINFEGLRFVSAQLERLILYIYPTMVAGLAFIFLKERVTTRHMLALGLAYLGVFVLFGAEIGHQGPHVVWGGFLIFSGALIYAIYVTASKSAISRMGSALFTAFAMSAASVVFLGQASVEALISGPPPMPSANGIWLAVFLSAICTIIPSFLIADAIGRIGPGATSAIGGVGPVIAAWAAVAILHEPFGWPHFLAMALTILGVWLLARPPRPRMGVAAAQAGAPNP